MKFKLKSIFRSKKSTVISISNDNCTTFNDFNHDLLFEIFDYLSYTDTLQVFNNLNSYIQEAIEGYSHAIDLRIHTKYPHHIRSLKITMTDHVSAFNMLKSAQISSLRAISLANLRPQHVLRVLNSIPYERIEYIYIGICAFDKTYSTLEMLSNIQTHALSLSQYRLKQCYFKEEFAATINNLPQQLISLEYLYVVSCADLFIISQLINRTPNLKYLHVSTLNIHQNPFISNQFYLTTLSFRPHVNCSIDEFRLFLQECCPNLKRLIAEVYYHHDGKQGFLRLNKSQWLTIFPKQLEYFHFKYIKGSSIHFHSLMHEYKPLPLKEQILFDLDDIQRHYCEILVDPSLILTWTKD